MEKDGFSIKKVNASEFRELLVLSYFFYKENFYDLKQLLKILGLSIYERDEILIEVIQNKELEYSSSNLLTITDKGQERLKKFGMENYFFPLKIQKEKANRYKSRYTPYCPSKLKI